MARFVPFVHRGPRVLWVASAVLLTVLMLPVGVAGGQEGSTTTTTTTQDSTTTAPPTTVVLDDGNVGIVPPGADREDPTTTTPTDDTHAPPDDREVAADTASPQNTRAPRAALPDPTPGLNAARSSVDVARANRALAEGAEIRRDAEEALAWASENRRSFVEARRVAGARLLAAKAVVDQFAVQMVMFGDTQSLDALFGEADLEELRELELNEVAADEVDHVFDRALAAYRAAVADERNATAALDRAVRADRAAQASYLELRRAKDKAIRAAGQSRRQGGPSILGPTVLEVEDLLAWYQRYYRVDPPVAPIVDIIEAYLSVGEEEGVTGDIAFAQAVLETGGFRSGHARGFNFAGIGAYDRCSPTCGFRFPSLHDGVRAHIHLLRAYADPGLTTAQLAANPHRLVAPERVGVRGCCQRWTQLTGVWASDPNYDRKVLGIYRLMVEAARARDAVAA